jgi:hypothetical protein
MSGTAFSSWAITDKRTLDVRNKKLSEATDCPLTSSQEYVDCLRKIDARVLVRKNILVRKAFYNYFIFLNQINSNSHTDNDF